MIAWWWIPVSLSLGACLGFVCCALLRAGAEFDRKMEEISLQQQNPKTISNEVK